MKTIIDDYLYGSTKDKINNITETLRDNKYARLKINLRHPYNSTKTKYNILYISWVNAN